MINRQLKNNVIEIYEDDALVLMISETISGCTMLMRVFGKLKSTVAFELEDELMAALTVCDVIRVDMANVKYISGNALQSLLSVQRVIDEMNLTLTILSPSDEVQTVFDDCGFSGLLEVEYE